MNLIKVCILLIYISSIKFTRKRYGNFRYAIPLPQTFNLSYFRVVHKQTIKVVISEKRISISTDVCFHYIIDDDNGDTKLTFNFIAFEQFCKPLKM